MRRLPIVFHAQTDDEKAVSQALDRLFETYVARDMEGMLSCYAPDLVVIPQNRVVTPQIGDPVYGLQDWRAVLAGVFDSVDIQKFVYKPQEITIIDNLAWEWHLEWSTLKRKATDETFVNYIKGAHIFRRQGDGSWKIARYIFNFVRLEDGVDPEAHMRNVLAKVPRT